MASATERPKPPPERFFVLGFREAGLRAMQGLTHETDEIWETAFRLAATEHTISCSALNINRKIRQNWRRLPRHRLSVPGQILDDWAVRAIIAMAAMGQVDQRIAHGLQFGQFAVDLLDMTQGHCLDV